MEDFYPYIKARLPTPGYVDKLIIPEKTPNVLFALVYCHSKPEAPDKTGLYVLDVSEITKIKQISYLPIANSIRNGAVAPMDTLYSFMQEVTEATMPREGTA